MKSVDCGTVPECSGRVAPGPRRFRAERHHRPLDAFQLPELESSKGADRVMSRRYTGESPHPGICLDPF